MDQGALCPPGKSLAGGLSSPVISPWTPVGEGAGREYGTAPGEAAGSWGMDGTLGPPSTPSLPHLSHGDVEEEAPVGTEVVPSLSLQGLRVSRAFKVSPILQTGAEGFG